jgi:hypothetical protein
MGHTYNGCSNVRGLQHSRRNIVAGSCMLHGSAGNACEHATVHFRIDRFQSRWIAADYIQKNNAEKACWSTLKGCRMPSMPFLVQRKAGMASPCNVCRLRNSHGSCSGGIAAVEGMQG